MEEVKKENEVLAEIYRNAQLALVSISDILPEVEDAEIKEEILRQHEEYERICSEAASLAHKLGVEVKEPNPMKKAMMWSAIKMNAAHDNSAQNIAQMMVKGTVQGITSLKTSQTDAQSDMNEEVKKLLKDLISCEEQFEEKWKAFL